MNTVPARPDMQVPPRKKSYKGWIIGGVAALLILPAVLDSESESTPDVPSYDAPADSGFTASQENAIESAESYLAVSAFSESGLIEQLEFEGFPRADAEFAVDHISVDWNEQAAKSAASYLDVSSFSRSGLIEQLEFEGFTTEQATYGVDQTGL